MKITLAKIIVPVAAILALSPFVSSAVALVAGLMIALLIGNPYPTKNWIHLLLGISVAGMGAGMNLESVARVGFQGIGYTVISIASVIALGMLLKRLFKVEDEIALLVTIGTAICGGSAIAAVTPVLRAKSHSVSVALGTVFILNAVALVIFPPIGHFFHMTERAFGLWSALAIHDTSSVVGATVTYGKIASEIGTTVKLARALWIVPVTLAIGYVKRDANEGEETKAKKPWFIIWFLIAAALVTWMPGLQPAGHVVDSIAKRLLVLTLFLIGLGLSRETMKSVGLRPLFLGVALWIITATVTLVLIQNEIIG
jgi:uncharacterized integral membrane protein (TIGR00698 family)